MEKINKCIFAHVYVTSKCNLCCKHCYSANNNSNDEELTGVEIINTVKTLCDNYDAYIDMEGGELFLRTDIKDIFEHLDDTYLNKITVTTNGTINPYIDIKKLSKLGEFRVSIEGHNDEIHKYIRGISLEPVIRNCKYWIANGIDVVARITLHKMNYKYIDLIIEKLLSVGICKYSFYEFQPVGRGDYYSEELILDESDIREAINNLKHCISKYTDIKSIKMHLTRKRSVSIDDIVFSPFQLCDISHVPTITVNYEGSVGICPWKISANQKMNIRNGPLENMISEVIDTQMVRHLCDYCSEVKLTYTK